MPEVTYVSEVECVVVQDGIMDSQVVKVIDFDGRGHTLRIDWSAWRQERNRIAKECHRKDRQAEMARRRRC